jgi:Na+-transporting methylmalonyl-CoA/oxaloacetate decarboxylase gamma subunit
MQRIPDAESASATPIYLTIIGVSVLLCFAFLLTGSFWLTAAVVVLGCLHIARHFPAAEEIVANDIALRWLRRLSPAIIVGIFLFMLASRYV